MQLGSVRIGLVLLGIVWALGLAPVRAGAQLYGLDAPVPVAPFLDGALPTRTPNSPTSNLWDIVPAFPSLSFSNTLVIVPNPADTRLYVGSRAGVISSFENNPATSTTQLFMDLTDRVALVDEGGLLGLVFHPEFGTPGSPHATTFYVYYSSYCPTTADRRDINFAACNPGYPTTSTNGFFNTWLRLSRFQATFDGAAGIYRGVPASEEPLFSVRLYNSSHRGGGPTFANDGTLWVAIGDQFRYTTAQDIANDFEGGAIRIEVDVTETGGGQWTCPAGSHLPVRQMQTVTGNLDEMNGHLYCIPNDNPFQSPTGMVFEEFATLGHRNPHRISVDPVTGLIWSGEVGESAREEINILTPGRNYQWPYMEGKALGPRPKPASVVGIEQPPVIDFSDRTVTRALIGGYVYRGTRFPELYGRYIAGDYIYRHLWAITLDQSEMNATAELLTTFDPGSLATFGQDRDGEILLGSVAANIPLQRFERLGAPIPDAPPLLSQVGAFDDLATLDVHDGAIPYDLVPFWSDGAAKQRWLFLPNDGTRDTAGEKIGFSVTGDWTFPTGTVLMKHFELPLDETNPSIRRRLETRFIVKGDDGRAYGLTYRWRPNGSDADLLDVAQTEVFDVALAGGGTRSQTWLYPGRNDCLQCHSDTLGGVLGLRTHQQNRDFTYPSTGRRDNQLRTWNHLGMFSPALVESQIGGWLSGAKLDDATKPLESRARSWLDSNCSYCHRPDTGNRASFDARFTTPFAAQGLAWGGIINNLGLSEAYILRPGDPSRSIAHLRIAAAGGAPIAMPPLAKDLADPRATALLHEWILRIRPEYPRGGVAYEYYHTSQLSSLPNFDALTPIATGTAGTFDVSLRLRDDDFAFRYRGYVEIPTSGTWTFYTNSSDGSRLSIDGALLVNNDGIHPAQERSGAVVLLGGFHAIEVTMFERDQGELLDVSWQGPGVAKQAIPPSRLYREIPIPIVNQAPTLVDPPNRNDAVGSTIALSLAASDPDGDSVYYDASNLPAGLSLNSTSGLITGNLGSGSAGFHTVTVSASDGPAVDVETFNWTVPEPGAKTLLIWGSAVLSLLARRRQS